MKHKSVAGLVVIILPGLFEMQKYKLYYITYMYMFMIYKKYNTFQKLHESKS